MGRTVDQMRFEFFKKNIEKTAMSKETVHMIEKMRKFPHVKLACKLSKKHTKHNRDKLWERR